MASAGVRSPFWAYELLRDGVTVYAGQTGRLPRRLQEHAGDKRFDAVRAWPAVTRGAARARETELIRQHRPEYNQTHGLPWGRAHARPRALVA
jgi:hypothetical protein